jgi:hypothetical protein
MEHSPQVPKNLVLSADTFGHKKNIIAETRPWKSTKVYWTPLIFIGTQGRWSNERGVGPSGRGEWVGFRCLHTPGAPALRVYPGLPLRRPFGARGSGVPMFAHPGRTRVAGLPGATFAAPLRGAGEWRGYLCGAPEGPFRCWHTPGAHALRVYPGLPLRRPFGPFGMEGFRCSHTPGAPALRVYPGLPLRRPFGARGSRGTFHRMIHGHRIRAL